MNSKTGKLTSAQSSTDKGRPRAAAATHTSGVDDEFREFFNQGDIGDYDGGVAYSQPPSKPQLPADEPLVVVDASLQRARRAFFARVVAVVVTACVALLVTAVRFKPHDEGKGMGIGIRHSVAQVPEPGLFRSPGAAPSLPAPIVQPAAPPPPALEVAEPEQAEVLEAPTEAAQKPSDPTPSRAQPQAEPVEPEIVVAQTKPHPKPAEPKTTATGGSARESKPVVRREQKSSVTSRTEAQPPALRAPAAVRESVAAFPID